LRWMFSRRINFFLAHNAPPNSLSYSSLQDLFLRTAFAYSPFSFVLRLD
jgi:hypothetical protein